MSEDFVFDFEKLAVYQLGVEFTTQVFMLCKKFSRDAQFSLGDQFRRAALSIVNNLAEGSGKVSTREKKQFYRHSLNSVRECIPVLTVCKNIGEIDDATHREYRKRCILLAKMLGKLIRSVDDLA